MRQKKIHAQRTSREHTKILDPKIWGIAIIGKKPAAIPAVIMVNLKSSLVFRVDFK